MQNNATLVSGEFIFINLACRRLKFGLVIRILDPHHLPLTISGSFDPDRDFGFELKSIGNFCFLECEISWLVYQKLR
jgi:hypothetical protein